MKHTQLDEMRDSLQKIMLRAGGRLSSLDGEQIVTRMRNNNIEGKAYPSHLTSIGDTMAAKQQVIEGTENTNAAESVAPAGGKTDAEVVGSIFEALKRPGSTVVVGAPAPTPYSRVFLEAAIPTVTIISGIVAGAAALTFIDSKWGTGARQNKLIDKGLLDVKALGKGGISMDLATSK